MTASGPLPVITVGGYLGSGKTTLINHLLRNADGRRLAVLVNEFGDLPIDADLIEAEGDNLISIAGGCICCSFGNDLVGALGDMRGLVPRPDYVVVESSGVAIPGAIVATMLLAEGFRSEGIVVVVDASTIRKAAADEYIGDTVMRQLADANIVVVNKLDLVPDEAGAVVQEWLAETAPQASLIPATRGKAPFEALVGFKSGSPTGLPGDHADNLFESVVLSPGPVKDVAALARMLAGGGRGVVRAKGHVADTDGSMWLVQIVGRQWQVVEAAGTVEPGIVVIGLKGGLDAAGLKECLGSMATVGDA